MALPASAVERKKAEANENTFVIKPAVRKRFPAPAVRDVIRGVFRDFFPAEAKASGGGSGGAVGAVGGGAGAASAAGSDSKGAERRSELHAYTSDLAKELADSIRTQLKALELPRYKILVHVVVGENRGEGVRVGTRCLWDTTTDSVVHESYTNDALFAVATVYGVYLY